MRFGFWINVFWAVLQAFLLGLHLAAGRGWEPNAVLLCLALLSAAFLDWVAAAIREDKALAP